MNLTKKIVHFLKYLLIFSFFLLWNLLIQGINLDEIWNYGFSHSMYRGLLPYKDYNMIITPLSPFIMSLPFHIFGSSMLVFDIEQAVILTIIFYLVEKKIKERDYFFMLFLLFPLSITFPSYNIFLLLLFLIVINLEEKERNDYLIGFTLGLCILTKQSVGTIMLLPSLYYLRTPKKIIKRLIGLLIPCSIFLIYLINTNSLSNFLDLCLFGLFDFTGNGYGFNICTLGYILMLLVALTFIKKDRLNINYYYFLSFSSLLIPLCDLYHLQIVLIAFIFIFPFIKTKIINLKLVSICAIIALTITSIKNISLNNYPNDVKYFNYKNLPNSYIKGRDISKYILDKYENYDIIFLTNDAYYYKIINDIDINYFDLINKGNLGYNGTNKLLNRVLEKRNSLFLINIYDINNRQIDKKVIKYVMNNAYIVEEIGKYRLYRFED